MSSSSPQPHGIVASPNPSEKQTSTEPGSKTVFTCTFPGCGKSFPKAAKFDRHLRSHSDERPFICQHEGCGASYKRSEHLKVHQRRHQDASDKSFRCTEPGCDKVFWTSSHLKNHIRAVHRDETVKVGTKTFDIGSLRQRSTGSPMNTRDDSQDLPEELTEYRCTEEGCTAIFHKRKVLRAHVREVHTDVAVASALNESGISHSGSGEADQEIAKRVLLPFACHHPGCSMRFATNSKRKTHAKTHQEGRYTCSMTHTEPQHPQEGEGYPEATSNYVYTFPTWTALQAHMKACHPPKCPWPGCGKTFSRQDNLRAHFKRHEARKARLEAEAKLCDLSGVDTGQTQWALLDDVDSDLEGDSSSSESGRAPPAAPSVTLASDSQETAPDFTAMASELFKTRPRRSSRFSTPTSSPHISVKGLNSPQIDGLTMSTDGTGQVGFRCPWNGCGRVLSRKSGLSIHIRTTHLGETPFSCPSCGRKFGHKHLVSRHRRVCSQLRAQQGADAERQQHAEILHDKAEKNQSGNLGDDNEAEPNSTDPDLDTPEQRSPPEDYEDEDDYFRSEGGAVPERDAERGKALRSSRLLSSLVQSPTGSPGAETPNQSSVELSGTISTHGALIRLLTGKGYSGLGHASNANKKTSDTVEGDGCDLTNGKRRRPTRNRVLECPWHDIIALAAREGERFPKAFIKDVHSSVLLEEGTSTSADSSAVASKDQQCPYRFSRVYDLRRHLKASHGLDLEDREVRSWIQGN